MKITFLSGGTGTPKLIRGFRKIVPDADISVIVNTAEDMWIYGSFLSPDVDTLMYLFAGLLDTDTWWGIKGDTKITNDFLKEIGEDIFLTMGDKDRAVNIARANLLNSGMTLTQATAELSKRLNVKAHILPMTNSKSTTKIATEKGLIHFQEYWVRYRGTLPILKVVREFEGDVTPKATPEAICALNDADIIILGPSNPVTSISPILECEGIKSSLMKNREKKPIVAISPFIGNEAVSGPANALMEAWGMAPSSIGTYGLYMNFLTHFVMDIRDTNNIDGALKFDTLMKDEAVSEKLARMILDAVGEKI